jgi:hypothetical protein
MEKESNPKESKFMQAERRRFRKLQNFQLLPNRYKKIGLMLAILSFLILGGLKFSGIEAGDLRIILRSLIICSLLLVAISRDPIEDELTLKLRGQAFVMAFIFGVIYTIIRSVIDYTAGNILSKEIDPNSFSSFELILVMLLIQIWFYSFAKMVR